MLTTNRGYTVIQVEPEKIIPALQDWQFEVDADIEGAISFRTNTPTLDISGAGPFSDEVNHQDQQLELYGAITGNRDIIWPTADTVVGPTIVYNRARPAPTAGYAAGVKYVRLATDADISEIISGIVAYWKLDEASGTRNDSVGGQHLTDNNTVTSTTGAVNNAAKFTAANSESLSRASSAVTQTGDIDFAFFLRFRADSLTGDQVLLSKDANTAGNREYTIIRNSATGKLRFQAFRAGDTTVFVESAETIVVGVTYCVWVWHNATADTVNIRIDSGLPVSAATGGALQAAGTANFRIGARDYSGSEGYFDGWIDETFMIKHVPTADEQARVLSSNYQTKWIGPGMARIALHSDGQILSGPQFDPLTDNLVANHIALGNGINDVATSARLPAFPDQRTGGAAGTQVLNIREVITDLSSHDPGWYDPLSGNGPYTINKREGIGTWIQIESPNALPSGSEIYIIRGLGQMQSSGSLAHAGNVFGTTGEIQYGEAGTLAMGAGLYGEFQHYGSGTTTLGIAVRGLFKTSAAAGAVTNARAGYLIVNNDYAVNMTTARALEAQVNNNAGGTMAGARTIDARVQNTGAGTMTAASGLRVQPPVNNGGGTIGTYAALELSDTSGVTGITTAYSLWVQGAGSINRLEGVLQLTNATAPGSSPADMVQLYSTDISAGNASLGIRTETAVVTESVSSDRTLAIKVNGTVYKVLLAA